MQINHYTLKINHLQPKIEMQISDTTRKKQPIFPLKQREPEYESHHIPLPCIHHHHLLTLYPFSKRGLRLTKLFPSGFHYLCPQPQTLHTLLSRLNIIKTGKHLQLILSGHNLSQTIYDVIPHRLYYIDDTIYAISYKGGRVMD